MGHVIPAAPDPTRETDEGLRLDFGDLPPDALQGTVEPYETIGFVDEALPALKVRFGAAAYRSADGGASLHDPTSPQGGLVSAASAAREVQVGMQLTLLIACDCARAAPRSPEPRSRDSCARSVRFSAAKRR